MIRTIAIRAMIVILFPVPLLPQGTQPYAQTYLAASHNWAFRDRYREADRLFNAFDYGHAVLSETLLARPGASGRLEHQEYAFITRQLLRHPPAVPLEERAIAPTFTRLVPELAAMFSWAHMLHRQVYDIWADERILPSRKDAEVARVVRYYQSRRDLALSGRPKDMTLMDGGMYAGAFRRQDPTFNGLIWSYHWLQMALYDVLMAPGDTVQKHTAVAATLERFRAMLDCAPGRLPQVMPMAAAVAPAFAARYPTAAAIFDNLHALHDVVSDILVSPSVPRGSKRAALLAAAAAYRDPVADTVGADSWRAMAEGMGVDRMGGSALPIRPLAPSPAACDSGQTIPQRRTPPGR